MKQWTRKHRALAIVIAIILVIGIAAVIVLPRIVGAEQAPLERKRENTVSLSKMDLTSQSGKTQTFRCTGNLYIRKEEDGRQCGCCKERI